MRAGPVAIAHRLLAAERLVGGADSEQRRRNARRLLEQGPQVGVDPAWIFAAERAAGGPEMLGQVCLLVPGAGRTGMVFLSGPEGDPVPATQQRAERAAAIGAALDAARADPVQRVVLAQALPDPGEWWAVEAVEEAGFAHAGDLAFLRGPLPLPAAEPRWPEGVRVRSAAQRGLGCITGPDCLLARILESSYVDTLDCPELCGLRTTVDVIASHRSTGRFDAALWWLAEDAEGEPAGCCLLSPVPDLGTVELVYLGVSPRFRGMGFGRALLAFAAGRAKGRGQTLTLAVDRRNAPALAVYGRAGLKEFAARRAFVRPIAPV